MKTDDRFRAADELELATMPWVHWFNETRLPSRSALGELALTKPGAIHR